MIFTVTSLSIMRAIIYRKISGYGVRYWFSHEKVQWFQKLEFLGNFCERHYSYWEKEVCNFLFSTMNCVHVSWNVEWLTRSIFFLRYNACLLSRHLVKRRRGWFFYNVLSWHQMGIVLGVSVFHSHSIYKCDAY